ncbi:transcription factor [Ganoderma sinense ZZ0214-1]|uniref:Transcription factor n=1 Tax=Ganoderma sinense ZZ0214-1 TaxID=1077348 RepID=A0A2G8SJF0_9APHY|nr:transcription factor [Ganoderma sinense ZZ0214-1]
MCTAHNKVCKYDPAAKMKRPSKKYVEALETRISKVEDLLMKLQGDSMLPGNDAENVESSPSPPAPQPPLRPSVYKHPHANWSSSKVIYPRGVHPTTDSSEESVDPSDNEEGFGVTDVNFKGYTGKSSNFDLVRTVIDMKSEHKGAPLDVDYDKPFIQIQKRFQPDLLAVGAMVSSIVPPLKEHDFPPPDVIAQLIGLYFEHFNTYLPVLHRPTFEREVQSGLHGRDRGFGTIVLLVCAIGSAWAFGSLNAEPHQAHGWQWFNRVSLTDYSLLARPRLYDVQVCALMAAYVNTTNSPQGTLPVISLGIRMAQDVGAHRKKMYSATPTVEQELWKRAFWALVAMDRLASFGMGRQCITHDEDFDLDPMIECDDEYWTHPDPAQAFKQPPGKPSIVAFANTFIRLLKIQAFASRTIFTINKSKLLLGYVGPEWKQSIVADVDSSLNKWLDAIPSHLRWDPNRTDDVFFNQSAILYANYYVLQIFVHRPFLPSPRRPAASANLSLPSMTICVNASRSCLRVLEVQHRRSMNSCSGFTLYALTPLQMPLFEVGMMLLVYLWAGARDIETTLKDVHITLAILKDLSAAGNLVARKLEIVLRAMCPPSSRPPSEEPFSTGPSVPSPPKFAQEGPKTIDELIAAAMQQLSLSGFRIADDCDIRADPTNGEILSLFTAPKRDLASPSPFVQTAPSAPAGATDGAEASPSAGFNRPFAGREGWADQLNALGRDFVPTRFPSTSASAAPSAPPDAATTLSAPAPTEPPSFELGAVPPLGPTYAHMGGEPELVDFTFGNALLANNLDLSFFGPLSSMFDNGQSQNLGMNYGMNAPPPSSVFGPPQYASVSAPLRTATTALGGAEEWSQAPANPAPMEVQSEGHGGGNEDQGPWQWQGLSAPQGELWAQWEAYLHNQGGTQPGL